ncbi:RNA polymerase sigma factor [Microbacterium sp. NPDC089313]|uniref:RNA polymerase sigma factor n=1 Tax=unclassified Microbacterium TaxID=2609290 RepID=UPI0024685A20|nr:MULTISPECIES: RNA polymerase sigma factor [unclassified Microbacterium]MDH5133934.1 RNA polymerase sigma factor [Microbacterium sp. RD10]MDH5137459.1 RNA polymerase sigma factor [Microbacterium sp. RD11]MDH5155601.1 RNA polymerase sigma factor [Microbacterium sp. RD06]MDH5166359.1 RNA polymerase sigma factor [Microbacterium sp. RD02]
MDGSSDPGTASAASAQEAAERAVAAVWRIESARIVGTLTRMVGDFGLAEDLAQEALVAALRQWPVEGVPRNAAAWLTAVAKRKAVDGWRRRERLDDRLALIAHELEQEQAQVPDLPWDPDAVDDDVLRLLFIACHPVLSREAQVALTLRVVGGLSTGEIARAFLIPTATVQQRIVRAKKTLAAAHAPFEVPPRDEHPARLGAVLGVLYLIFNEAHAASSGPEWMRPELSDEAIRLARVLAALQPREPEVHGLLALLELTAARFPARTDRNGDPVLLADQDRGRWDRSRIARGRAALATADGLGRGRGAYGLQAAIAECHAVAPSVEETDWDRIVVLYEALGRLTPSPVVELNRAAAVAMATGPASALRLLDELSASGVLRGYHLLPATRGELLRRLGRESEARSEFAVAAGLAGNDRERRLLERKARGAEG